MTAEKMSVGEMLSVLEAASWALAERDCTTDEFDIARAAVAAMAERERNLIRERTNAGLAAARARGRAGRHGGCPVLVFGITPKLIEDWNP